MAAASSSFAFRRRAFSTKVDDGPSLYDDTDDDDGNTVKYSLYVSPNKFT